MPVAMRFPDGIIRFKEQNEYTEILSDEEAGNHHLEKTIQYIFLMKNITMLS
jgi:hypothetical protein